jgi:hypothetical protein
LRRIRRIRHMVTLIRRWRWRWRHGQWWLRRRICGDGRIERVIGVVRIDEMAVVVVPVLGLVCFWRITRHLVGTQKRDAYALCLR